MRAVDQWAAVEAGLGSDWAEARLAFTPEGPVAEAAAILLPLRPGIAEGELRIALDRSLGDATTLRNVLERLDRKRIWGRLTLLGVVERGPSQGEPQADERVALAQAWEKVQATLPPDWSDLLCELELDSSDWLPRAALLGAPLNPARVPGSVGLRFRASKAKGYGTPPEMVLRCLERMDAAGITGRLSVVVGLSDTDNAVTQGPVWRIAGRSV